MINLRSFNEYKNNTLIKSKQQELTYGQVFAAAKTWSHYLQSVAPTGTIALSMTNCPEAHIIMLAAFLQHNVVMLNPDMLKVSPGLVQRLNIDHIVTFDDTLIADTNVILIPRSQVLDYIEETDVVHNNGTVILLSSGTTGIARPVKFTSDEAYGFATSLMTKLQFTPSDCLYNVAPYYHGFGFLSIFTVVETGGSYYMPGTSDYKNIVADINHYNCTWVSVVPNFAKIMIKNLGTLNSNFRFAMAGGDTCSESLCSEFRERFGVELLANYGFTDGGCVSITTPMLHKDGSVGKVSSDTVRLSDSNEILIYQPWLESKKWLPTGDIGFIDADGFLWIRCRKKDIIKRQGKTIYPGELESHLAKVPGVTELVVYNDGQNNKGDRIGIVYSGTIVETDLKDYCVDHLPADYHPNSILKLDDIPRFNNKISRTWIKNYVDQLQ